MKTDRLREWTYEDYLMLSEEGPLHYEIIDGELCMTPAPNTCHQRIISNLHFHFKAFLLRHLPGEIFLSPYDVVFSREWLQVIEPDLIFVSKDHFSIITERISRVFRTCLSRFCLLQRKQTIAA